LNQEIFRMENANTLVPDQIYSTAQAAGLLGIGEGTIRSRKSREKEKFIEGQHWVQQDGSTFWTCAGVLELAQGTQGEKARNLLESAGALVPSTSATPSVAGNTTEDVAEAMPNATTGVAIDMGFLEPLLEATGQSLALEFYRRLPEYVLRHVQRMAKTPTDEERRVIQAAFQPIQRLQQEVGERCVS
jgi:hypothetical protein